jgi:hypothetical protein
VKARRVVGAEVVVCAVADNVRVLHVASVGEAIAHGRRRDKHVAAVQIDRGPRRENEEAGEAIGIALDDALAHLRGRHADDAVVRHNGRHGRRLGGRPVDDVEVAARARSDAPASGLPLNAGECTGAPGRLDAVSRLRPRHESDT